MRIKLDDKHYLNSDQWCYWITVEIKSEKTNKEYEKRITGYCSKLEDIFCDYIDKKLKSDTIDSLRSLVDEVKTLKASMKEFAEAIEENKEK